MCCSKKFIAGRTIKTAAALTVVVFLLCSAGGCTGTISEAPGGSNSGEKHRKKPARKRAYEYSRIPGNYPAGWQTMSIGN